MITVESFFNQVTDPKQILASMKEMLAAVNPQFAVEEQKYKEAAKILLESVENVLPSAEEYLAALEERYGCELLYIGQSCGELSDLCEIHLCVNPCHIIGRRPANDMTSTDCFDFGF